MNEPVIPEKRKRLTRPQRAAAHDRHGGVCCICGLLIPPGESFIDEHKKALGLGGSNEQHNRGIAHIQCAKIKTREDQNMIAKAVRTRAKLVYGIKNPNRRRIPSRGWR
jgi:5-methylcytosine-specific restriction protein A